MHEPKIYAGLHTEFDFTFTVKTVIYMFFRLPVVSCISDEDFECFEQFVVLLCNITSPCISVNERNKFLFIKKYHPIENIPPKKAALEQHIKQVCCKAGKTVRVINEISLDSLISKTFCMKIMLFMRKFFVCT